MAGYVREQIAARKAEAGRGRLALAAKAELERIRAATVAEKSDPRAALSLVEYVHALSPHHEAPSHLAQVADLFERAARGESVRACVSVPAQHGKTTLLQHGIVQALSRHPDWPIVYASYAAEIAYDKSKETRDLAREAGLTLREDTAAAGRWRLVQGGGLLSTGVGGPLTGYAAKLVVVDDPHKNREEAESRRERDRVEAWLRSTAITRIAPGGSCVVVHTRWHPDDLIGRLERDGWEVVNLPAIDDDDCALWPSQRPREFLRAREREVGPYEWAAIYMGNPRARGGAVFERAPITYSAPPALLAKSIGLDLAYTAKTSADWSVAVVMGREGMGESARYYVLDVVRRQMRAPEFAALIKLTRAAHPLARARIYAAGTERGALDYLTMPAPNGAGISVDVRAPHGDKFVRAQPLATAWNAGRIHVPESAPWASEFCDELARFTGISDPHDDQIDAAAAAFDVLAESHEYGLSSGTPRMTAHVADAYGAVGSVRASRKDMPFG